MKILHTFIFWLLLSRLCSSHCMERKTRHIASACLSYLTCTLFFYFIDSHYRLNRYKATFNARKFIFQLLFRGINDHLRFFAEYKLFNFQKSPKVTLKNMSSIYFINLSLIKEAYFIDWFFRHISNFPVQIVKNLAIYNNTTPKTCCQECCLLWRRRYNVDFLVISLRL